MGLVGQRHAPVTLPPGKRCVTHCIGGWVSPKPGLDGCGKSRLPPGFDPRTVQHVASRYIDWAIPAHRVTFTFTNFPRSEEVKLKVKKEAKLLDTKYGQRGTASEPSTNGKFTRLAVSRYLGWTHSYSQMDVGLLYACVLPTTKLDVTNRASSPHTAHRAVCLHAFEKQLRFAISRGSNSRARWKVKVKKIVWHSTSPLPPPQYE